MSGADGFFEEMTEQSAVKVAIVGDYFEAWAKVMKNQARSRGQQMAYVDLFAGAGRYKDGSPSTPILVLEKVIADPDLRDMTVTIFNEGDPNRSRVLREHIDRLPGIERLRYPPQVHNQRVGQQVVEAVQGLQSIPTLFFVDPFGYKGLTLGLISSLIQGWGCDCIVFFNYNRINMDVNNPIVEEHMNALFGTSRANAVRARLEPLSPTEREKLIVEEMQSALRQLGANYILPFRFMRSDGSRTMHYLLFLTKNFKGFEIMKSTMASKSSTNYQGVASFEHNLFDVGREGQACLFELVRPLDDLEQILLADFAGKTITFRRLYEQHSGDKPFGERNYKDVLLKLESEGTVRVEPPLGVRPRRRGQPTFGDNVEVTFPARRQ